MKNSVIIGNSTYYYIKRQLTEELTEEKTVGGRIKKRIGIREGMSIFKLNPTDEDVSNLFERIKDGHIMLYSKSYYVSEIKQSKEEVEITIISDDFTKIEEFVYI